MKIQDQPPTASAQDPKPTVAQLKARQEMILQHLQNHSNNRDSKTLVLKKIGMKHIAMQIYNKVTNIWPVMEYQFARRGLSFLPRGCTMYRHKILRNGSVRIWYDAQFRIRNSIFDLKWFLYNLNKCKKILILLKSWIWPKTLHSQFSHLFPTTKIRVTAVYGILVISGHNLCIFWIQ